MNACKCLNLRARFCGNAFADSNIRMFRLTVECEDCGLPFRVLGAARAVTARAPGSLDDGETTVFPIAPVGEEPKYRLAS